MRDISLSFSTFKFNIRIILNWHFSILLFSLSFFYCTEFPRIIRIVESSVVSSQMLKNRKSSSRSRDKYFHPEF